MTIKRILAAGKKGKTDCNFQIPDFLQPFFLPGETVEKLESTAKRMGIPVEALVCSILQEAF